MCGRSGKLRLCVLYVYSIVVFIRYYIYIYILLALRALLGALEMHDIIIIIIIISKAI